jgi:uncharacterized protein
VKDLKPDSLWPMQTQGLSVTSASLVFQLHERCCERLAPSPFLLACRCWERVALQAPAMVFRLSLASFVLTVPLIGYSALPSDDIRSDVIIVGAGISGLSAALEAARSGVTVTVIDMSSVFGGHAVMAEGGVSVVDSPMHRERGLNDSPELAYQDFVTWGEDVNRAWAKHYVDHSRKEVFDWLRALGVEFDRIRITPGNALPRFHEAVGRGLGLVMPIYRECIGQPNVSFNWNTQVTKLLCRNGRIEGVEVLNLRTGASALWSASAVILATGGFQNNLNLLREHWPKTYNFPTRLLLGSGMNSMGLGHSLALEAGAQLSHLDYQWHYPFGLPDPRDGQEQRGLSARNTGALWVNAHGHRFVNELLSSKLSLPEVLRQPGGTYWAIFDEPLKPFLQVSGTDWRDRTTVERLIISNPKLVKRAPTLDELADAANIPPAALQASIARYNQLVTDGHDRDFARFGPSSQQFAGKTLEMRTPPRRVETPPYYAIQFYPLTRKNNGGVAVDLSCRVLTTGGDFIPGLFAVGELTGSGGMNGKAGLEGVWLGPGILMGRVAGKAAAAEVRDKSTFAGNIATKPLIIAETKSCTECHKIDDLIASPRRGYWHFERVHRVVRERLQNCVECHSELIPNPSTAHRSNQAVRTASCVSCHGGG